MIVTFTDEIRSLTTDEALHQWDIGQVIDIYGLDVLVAPQLHFATRKSDVAYVVQGVFYNGGVRCNIPNAILQDGCDIACYIYIDNEVEKHTIKQIIIPVIKRVKPSDYVIYPDEFVETRNLFEQLASDFEDLSKEFATYDFDRLVLHEASGTPNVEQLKDDDDNNIYPITTPYAFDGILPINKGGTEASDKPTARANLGLSNSLWNGSWASGSITVPNSSEYRIFAITLKGQATSIIAIKTGDDVRGIGGYATSNGLITQAFSSRTDGDNWTLVRAIGMIHNAGGSHSEMTLYDVERIRGIC